MTNSLSTTVRAQVPGPVGEPVTERYELRRELARGGQSVVWVAFDRQLGREVAFKMPLPEPDGRVDPLVEARFLREARLTARLDHPNVVTVHEFGRTTDGRPFCAQRLVQGDEFGRVGTLAEAMCAATTLRERLALLPRLLEVCNAVAYAHRMGIVHRDLKPDNVVLGRLGETVVLDWGLGRVLGEADDTVPPARTGASTLDGQVLGTPLYMSPEQARGERDRVGPRSDVWSLGVMLFETLTGTTPFASAGTLSEVIGAAQERPVPALASVAPGVPRALAAVVERALERNEARRYPDAGALARDLKAFLDGRTVGVYDYSATELLWLAVERNRPAAAFALTACLLALAAGMALARSAKANRESLAEAYVEKGRLAEGLLRWEEAAAWYVAARTLSLREDAAAGLRVVWPRASQPSRLLLGHAGAVRALAVAPDGSTLFSGGADRTIRGWRLSSGEPGRIIDGLPQSVNALAVSHDGRTLWSGGDDDQLRAWDVSTGEQREVFQLPDAVNALAVAPSGAALAIACEDGTGLVLSGGALRVLARHRHPVYAVAFSPDGAHLASGSWDGEIQVHEVSSGRLVASFEGHAGSVLALAFHPGGAWLASAGRDTTVRLWDTATWAASQVLLGNTQKTYALAWADDGALLASAGADGTSRVWKQPRDRTPPAPPGARLTANYLPLPSVSMGRDDELLAMAAVPGQSMLVTGGRRGVITVRRLDEHASLLAGAHELNSLEQLADGRLAVQLHRGFALVSSDLAHAEVHGVGPADDPGALDSSMCVAVTLDGRLAVTGGFDGFVTFYDVRSRRVLARVNAHQSQLDFVGFSPDEGVVLSAGRDGQVFVWDARRFERAASLPRVREGVFGAAFSPDGRQVATAGYDRRIRVYDTASWALLRVLEGHEHGVRTVTYSPDSSLLASGGWDRSVRLWRASSGEALAVLHGHQDVVTHVAFSPDGRLLASASHDATVRLWDMGRRAELVRFMPDEGRANRLLFSRDRTTLYYARQGIHRIDLVDENVPRSLPEVLKKTGLTLEGLRMQWTPQPPDR